MAASPQASILGDLLRQSLFQSHDIIVAKGLAARAQPVAPDSAPVLLAPQIKNLNISKRYCADNPAWNEHCAIRELVQNWRDQCVEVIGPKFQVVVNNFLNHRVFTAYDSIQNRVAGFILEEYIPTTSTSTISLVNYATRLPDEALVLGASSKTGNANMAGHHGEGLKVAANLLLTKGIAMGIITKGEEWRFFHQDEVLTLAKSPNVSSLLRFDFHRDTTVFIVAGFPACLKPEDYLFLSFPFSMPETGSLCDNQEAPRTRLFNLPALAGKVFVKGIKVQETAVLILPQGPNKTIGLGIDLVSGFTLSRDRNDVPIRSIADAIFKFYQPPAFIAPNEAVNEAQMVQAKSLQALSAILYRAIESCSSSVPSAPLLNGIIAAIRPKDDFCKSIFAEFANAHKAPMPMNDQDIPSIMPIRKGTGDEVKQDYEYFLGLTPDKIVECNEMLMTVLEMYQPSKSIDEYIRLFWDKLLTFEDYNFDEANHGRLRDWIKNQIELTFKSILTHEQFLFKVFPLRTHPVSTKGKSVRVIKEVRRRPYSTYVVIDCRALFSSCDCASVGNGPRTCFNKCVQSEFLSSLKSSLFRGHDGMKLRAEHEKQSQALLIMLSGDSEGDVVLPMNQQISRPIVAPSASYVHRNQEMPQLTPNNVPNHRQGRQSDVLPGSSRTKDATTTYFESSWSSSLEAIIKRYYNESSRPFDDSIVCEIAGSNSSEPMVEVGCGCGPVALAKCRRQHQSGMTVYFSGSLNHQEGLKLVTHYDSQINFVCEVLNFITNKLLPHNSVLLQNMAVYVLAEPQATDVLAFNRGGQIFVNVTSPANAVHKVFNKDSVAHYVVLLAHELAHNLHEHHGKAHESEMEALLCKIVPQVF